MRAVEKFDEDYDQQEEQRPQRSGRRWWKWPIRLGLLLVILLLVGWMLSGYPPLWQLVIYSAILAIGPSRRSKDDVED